MGLRATAGHAFVRAPMSLLCAVALAAISLGSSAASARAGTSGRVGYAQLVQACPLPGPGDASCMAVIRRPVAASSAAAAGVHPFVLGAGASSSGPAGGFTPAQLAGAYGYDPDGGSGQTVAVVDAYDDPAIEEDLAAFDQHYGLGECTSANGCFRKVNQAGSESRATLPPADTTGWSQEISLDVEVVRAVCRGCRILLVEADNERDSNLAAAEDTAVALGASEVSNSYGGAESGMSAEARAAFDHPGTVITAAAGDDGYDNWNYALDEYAPPGMPNAPASLPTVVSVGGTSLRLTAGGARSSETVWNDDGFFDENGFPMGYVAGSGCSTLFAAQLWQREAPGYAATGCGAKRLVADVSADADPLTGFDIYDNFNFCKGEPVCGEEVAEAIEQHGGWETFGGTSLSSPLIASLYALAGGSGGLSFPALSLYGHLGDAGALYDVTGGSTGLCDGQPASVCGHPNSESGYVYDCEGTTACNAAVGYDGPSGVGAPNGLSAFQPLFPSAAITPPAQVRAGVAASFSAAGSEDPYPGGSIASYAWDWGDGSAPSTGASPSHVYAETGVYTVTLTVTDNYGLTGTTSDRVEVTSPSTHEQEEEATRKREEEARRTRELEERDRHEEEATHKREEEAKTKREREEAAQRRETELAGEAELARLLEEARKQGEAAGRKAAEEAAGKQPEAKVSSQTGSTPSGGVESFHSTVNPPKPDARIATTSFTVGANGLVRLRVSCPAGVGNCRGSVTLRTLHAVLASAGAHRGKAAILTLASGGFTIDAGTSATVVLHLSHTATALLARSRRLQARASTADRDPAGTAGTAQQTLTLVEGGRTR